jgi:hypothetical protein
MENHIILYVIVMMKTKLYIENMRAIIRGMSGFNYILLVLFLLLLYYQQYFVYYFSY